tara:strand:+ start:1222 stop:2352 length:1131 start_codon:yes stop_codon:yes gene_type:complete
MRRKTDHGREAQQVRAMSLAKALRLTVPKVADQLFDLALAAIAIKVEEVSGDDVKRAFDDVGLLFLLDGPTPLAGAAMLDPLLVGALIQQQTMGRVLPDPGGNPRRMTDTDAAITAPFLEDMLKRAAALPDSEGDKRLLGGYSFGSRAEDVRLLAMALEAPAYKMMTVTVDVCGGVRQGQIVLCLPILSDVTQPFSGGEGDADQGEPAHRSGPETLSDTVMGLNIELNVSLARVRMPLGRLGALCPGDVLELDTANFDQVQLISPGGDALATGTLGQMEGMRALRMTHSAVGQMAPKRRAEDRAELSQAEPERLTAPVKHSARTAPDTAQDEPTARFDTPQQRDLHKPEMPDLTDLPELNLPDLDDLSDLPEQKAG